MKNFAFEVSKEYLSAINRDDQNSQIQNNANGDNPNNSIIELPTKSVLNDINTFFTKKFSLIVNMPNEERLGQILNQEVGEYFNTYQSQYLSSTILEYLLDWFKNQSSTSKLAKTEADKDLRKDLSFESISKLELVEVNERYNLSCQGILNQVEILNMQRAVTEASIEYKREIKSSFGDNLSSHKESFLESPLAKPLMKYLISASEQPANGTVFYISPTSVPVAIKRAAIISLALNDAPYRDQIMKTFKFNLGDIGREDSFMVLKSSYITRSEEQMCRVVQTMKLRDSHFLLIVVLDNVEPAQQRELLKLLLKDEETTNSSANRNNEQNSSALEGFPKFMEELKKGTARRNKKVILIGHGVFKVKPNKSLTYHQDDGSIPLSAVIDSKLLKRRMSS